MKDLLLVQIEASFRGPNTSHPTVVRALRDLTAAEAGWKPAPKRHSIWQIVEHLGLSRRVWSEFLQGRPMHVDNGWPPPAGGDDEAWRRSVQAIVDAHEDLKRVVGGLSDEVLLNPPTRRPPCEAPPDATLLQILLWEVPTHDAYHAGQIRYLRALQGI